MKMSSVLARTPDCFHLVTSGDQIINDSLGSRTTIILHLLPGARDGDGISRLLMANNLTGTPLVFVLVLV